MRLAFSTIAAAGHLNPMTTLARKMRERGHEVVFAGIPDAEPAVRHAGLEFHPVAEREFPAGSVREQLRQLSRLSGLAGVRYTVEFVCKMFEAEARYAPGIFRRMGAQAAVMDQICGGFSAVAMRLGMPLVHIANALPVNLYDSVPPPMVGWRHRSGYFARLRNRACRLAFQRLLRPYLSGVADYYRQLGLEFDLDFPNGGLSKLAQISQVPAAFDLPNAELPPWFHHAGPFHDGQGRAAAPFPWDRLSGEPLIYVSMGTVQNGFEHVFRTIAEACSGLGCQLALSIGGNLTLESVGPLAGNCIAVEYAPQVELLRRAALCITHAGLNTALESLAAGVPMVAIPVTNDQPGVAARVVHSGTGAVVPYRRLTRERLRRAVRRVLEDGRYQENARRMQAAIQAANGLERAADLIEGALGRRGAADSRSGM
jgi:UDP:flavonoid glycosyltransferase YjiC (YdhE family)